MVDLDFSSGLDGIRAVITGGASGIGAAIATAYASRGARVAVWDVAGPAAEERATAMGAGHLGVACDVTSTDSVQAALDVVRSRFGSVEVLVNSAGVAQLAPAEELSDEAWNTTLAVNLTGAYVVSRAVGRVMLEQGRGTIISLASQAATVALPGHAAYCASKAGLVGLTKVLAAEWAGRGVTANTISPTVVLTDLGRRAWAGERGDALRGRIPTQRFALPEEIAAAAVYLASPAAAMINGHDLVVDGGYTIQ